MFLYLCLVFCAAEYLQWKNLTTVGIAPRQQGATCNAIMIKGSPKLFVIGGRLTANLWSTNVISILDIKTNTWHEESIHSIQPRSHHTSVEYNGKLYIFGGRISMWSVTNELLIYDIESGTVTKGNSTNAPRARFDHAAAIVNGKMYIHGGATQQYVIGDLAIYSIENNIWESITQTNEYRLGHQMIAYNYNLYIIGGFDGNNYYPNHVSVYDIDRMVWSNKAATSPSRTGHTATLTGNIVWIIGGQNETNKMDDVVIWHIENDLWEPTNPKGMFEKRQSHCADINPINPFEIYVQGGGIGYLTVYNDVKILQTNDFTNGKDPYSIQSLSRKAELALHLLRNAINRDEYLYDTNRKMLDEVSETTESEISFQKRMQPLRMIFLAIQPMMEQYLEAERITEETIQGVSRIQSNTVPYRGSSRMDEDFESEIVSSQQSFKVLNDDILSLEVAYNEYYIQKQQLQDKEQQLRVMKETLTRAILDAENELRNVIESISSEELLHNQWNETLQGYNQQLATLAQQQNETNSKLEEIQTSLDAIQVQIHSIGKPDIPLANDDKVLDEIFKLQQMLQMKSQIDLMVDQVQRGVKSIEKVTTQYKNYAGLEEQPIVVQVTNHLPDAKSIEKKLQTLLKSRSHLIVDSTPFDKLKSTRDIEDKKSALLLELELIRHRENETKMRQNEIFQKQLKSQEIIKLLEKSKEKINESLNSLHNRTENIIQNMNEVKEQLSICDDTMIDYSRQIHKAKGFIMERTVKFSTLVKELQQAASMRHLITSKHLDTAKHIQTLHVARLKSRRTLESLRQNLQPILDSMDKEYCSGLKYELETTRHNLSLVQCQLNSQNGTCPSSTELGCRNISP